MARPARGSVAARGAVGASGLSAVRLAAIRRAVDASCGVRRVRFVRRSRGATAFGAMPRRCAVVRVGLSWRGLVVRDGPRASWGAFWSGDCSFRAVSGMSPWFVGVLVWLVPLVVRLWVLVLAG